MDAVHQIEAFNAGRDPERLRIKYDKMRASAFAFLRGTCHLFYERLPRGGVFASAPLAWICGDLHLENFGSYKGDNRLVYFDLNDFEEAALAPVSWDLVRMLTSLWIAGESASLRRSEARILCEAFLDAYCASLAAGKASWVERATAQGLVRELLDGLCDRPRARFLDTRTITKNKRRRFLVDGIKALPATKLQHSDVTNFMATFARTQPDPGFFKVLDVARRIAGLGSLGAERYAILVRGKGSPDGNYLLDLKQSFPSALTPHLQVAQPPWKTQAHRVVALQRRLQAVSAAFLAPVMLGKKAYVLRDLQPSEDKIALGQAGQSLGELRQLVETMGGIVAWSQLRACGREGSATADELIAFGQRGKWRRALLDASRDCAGQVLKDCAMFNAAYDDGALAI